MVTSKTFTRIIKDTPKAAESLTRTSPTTKVVQCWMCVKVVWATLHHHYRCTRRITYHLKHMNKKVTLKVQIKEIQLCKSKLKKCNLHKNGNQVLNKRMKIHRKVSLWVQMCNSTTPWTTLESTTKKSAQCKFIKKQMKKLDKPNHFGKKTLMTSKLDKFQFILINKN